MKYACHYCHTQSSTAITKPASAKHRTDSQKRCEKCGARFYPPARQNGSYSRTGATVWELRGAK